MLMRAKITYTVEVNGKAKDYEEVVLIPVVPAYDFTHALDTIQNKLSQKHGWTVENITKFSYEKLNYPVEEVLCIKDVIMDVTEEVAFFAGNKYPIERHGIYIDAEDEQGESHGIGTGEDDEFFAEYFEFIKDNEE